MTRIKYLTFIQRGGKTYFQVLATADGAGKYSMEDMIQKYNLNVMDSELHNLIVVQDDGNLMVQSQMTFDADRLLADIKTAFPNTFTSATVVADPLALTTTTTTTTTTTSTTTETTTTTATTETTTTTTT